MRLVYQHMVIFFNFSPTSSHLRPLHVGNCVSNSRLVVDEDYNGRFRPERVKKAPRLALTLTKLKNISMNHRDQRVISIMKSS